MKAPAARSQTGALISVTICTRVLQYDRHAADADY
jgi:hypothetical protein